MLDLVMVLHCHQPVGNFDHVFETAVTRCYGPILDCLDRHPSIRSGFHVSGPLLEWLDRHRPGLLDQLARLVARGQVELLSGGFFEPLLAAIPRRDARGQLLMMNEYLESRFHHSPTGFWLTERVWDPSLPLLLAGTGMTYTVVDDTHFLYAGLSPREIYGPYITEKEGRSLTLLATPMIMRYLIPFKPVEEVIGHLRGMERDGRTLAVYGDDGEKFGLWPGTHEWVIEKGWLDTFFDAVARNSDWLRTVPPGEAVRSTPALGRVYLPQASYEEMTTWALPQDRGRVLEDMIAALKAEGRWDHWHPFVRGGVWDNFLVKYDESNRMHKKMLLLSRSSGDDRETMETLWRAQCNCAYWHGIFGGLYLGHLRRAVHEHLIRAQSRIHAAAGRPVSVHRLDLDMDGNEEILVWTPELSLGLDPAEGGTLFELCSMPHALNLSDTLTRRREAYHRELERTETAGPDHGDGVPSIHDRARSKDDGLTTEALVFDPYTRVSLRDHFVDPGTSCEHFASGMHGQTGDFACGAYGVTEVRSTSHEAVITLARTGTAGPAPLGVAKRITVGTGRHLTVEYTFSNPGTEPVTTRHGCEFNLTLYSDRDTERYYLRPDTGGRHEVRETGAEERVTAFRLVNRPDGLTTTFSFVRPVEVWFHPLMTVSRSEEGYERTYQGSCLLFLSPLTLPPGGTETVRFRLSLDTA